MLLKRFYDDTLAQASYMVGCQETGQALVVDPNRDIDQYIDAARAENLAIELVAETHIHADFVSGTRDLARRLGASVLLSGEGGDDWQYRFASTDGATLLRDGHAFDVGRIHVDVRHTPGHTPEHICFLMTDCLASNRPVGMLTGDFVFVGDVGRPDLLERAAHITGTMETMARTLFRSIRRLAELPDYLQLWPGHGAGSVCGKALGAVPSTTLGYERIANWAFQIGDESEFARAVLDGQPEPPRYFAVMKGVNRDGPPPPNRRDLIGLDPATLERQIATGVSVVDVRSGTDFGAEHIPGSLNIPFGRSFTNWAGSLLSYDADVALLANARHEVERASAALTLIGLDRVVAWGGRELRDAWRASGRAITSSPAIGVHELAEAVSSRDGIQLIDVRSDAEWKEGHIPGARHVFLADLPETARHLPQDARIVTQCQGGTRSAIAASLLRARGFGNVRTFAGGFEEWRKAGLPIVGSNGSLASDGSDG